MDEDFLIIAITSPDEVKDEAKRIDSLISSGKVNYVHLRKPSWDIYQMKSLIQKIPSSLHSKLKIHDNFSLLDEFDLGGIHLNFRNPSPHPKAKKISRSLHSIKELIDLHPDLAYEYVTLSPIFDSISKEGYKSGFDLDKISGILPGKNVIALGGVSPDKIPLLKEKGFYGAAMLGYFWKQ